jgi:TRAP-type C4-dicarboxylate transport system substrate-binding protein
MKQSLALGIAALMLGFAARASAQETVIRLATAAPEGSKQYKVMMDFGNEVKKVTNGRLSFKFHAGGTLGDDKTMLDKMKLGQIQAAGLTGVGLGEIVPEVRVLELPFQLSTYKQFDCVLNSLSDEFVQKFAAKGYVVLLWADTGLVYLLSNQNIQSVADMSKAKPWVWEADPVAKAAFSAFGIKPKPLPLQDVFTQLQTGMIDTVYISPGLAISLKWHTRVKYMVGLPIVVGISAVIMNKADFDKLAPDLQTALKDLGKKYQDKLAKETRAWNKASIPVLTDNGVQVVMPSDSEQALFRQKGVEAAKSLVPRLYSNELLQRVLSKIPTCK